MSLSEADIRLSHATSRLLLVIVMILVVAVFFPGNVGLAAEDEAQPAEVTREGYYTNDASEGLPPAITREFPHAIVCVLVPEACGEQLAPLHETVHGVITGGADAADAAPQPAQPVVPGTLPVGLLGGQERYTSALRFELPQVPEGQMISRLELVLRDSGFSYAMESPGFRRIVRAIVAQAADEPGPDAFADAIQRIATNEDPLLNTEITGVEACAITEAWEEGESQSGEEMPERDCILGGTGHEVEEGVWVFDLSFVAEAWREGEMANEGILLAPLGSPNLEYGDPDYSTNFVLAFAGSEAEEGQRPKIRATFDDDMTAEFELDGSPAVEAEDPPPAPSGAPESGFDGGNDFDNGFGGDSGAPQTTGDLAFDDTEAPVQADEPAAAQPETEPEMTPASEGLPDLPTPAFLWLLLPLFLGSGWWYGHVLDAQPAGSTARSGALSRISELREQG